MIRKIDELGRIVLPVEYRKALNIHERDELKVNINNGEIIIRKPLLECHFCGVPVDLVRIGNEYVCRRCIEKLHGAKEGETLFISK